MWLLLDAYIYHIWFMLWYSCDAIEYLKWIHGYMMESIMLYDATNGFPRVLGRTKGAYGLQIESKYVDSG
jgi:hypothetical protein